MPFSKKEKNFLLFALLIVGGVLFFNNSNASVQDEINARQAQIAELQRQIQEYQVQIDRTRTTSKTLENEIKSLNAKINQITLEIKSLELSINQTNLEIQSTEEKIFDASDKILKHRGALAEYLRAAYENDQESLTEILLKNANISDFFTDLNSIRTNQNNLQMAINNIRDLKNELEQQQENLENKKTDLERLRGLQTVEKRSLDSNRSEKNNLLKATRGQETKYQELITKSQKDIEKIREQLTFLVQHGISAEDAVKYAQLAAIRAGIRPAFLLAILEIESRLGQNVGTGNWRDDMYECYIRLGTVYYSNRKSYYLQRAETEKNAFFAITGKLGLDPDAMKVSKEPNYGCGGAMGPAQFIPSTWLAYEAEVARLTGHNPPNPWSIEDAFMASAIKLANGGASRQTRTGEDGAARAYIGGKTTCSSSICNYYANTVLRKADEIEKNL